MYYRRNQNEDPPPLVDPRVWLSLALIGLVLIAMGLILKAADAADLRDITAKVAGLDGRRSSLFQKLPTAEAEYQSNAPKFARHHSEGFDTRLQNARVYLEIGGDVQTLQTKAQGELDSGNRDEARTTWQSADEKLIFSQQIIDTLIHPKYYAELQKKVDSINGGYLDDVQRAIDQQRNYVAKMPVKYLCGTGSTLSYSSASEIATEAQNSLENARATAQLVLPEGVIDYPLAYDQASNAANQAKNVSSTADALSAQADAAVNEITSANTSLTQAAAKLSDAYDAVSAKSYYDQAVTAKDNAVDACSRQDFGSVTTYVSSSKSFSNLSIDAATPPTATPVPPPTSEPDTEEDEETVEYNYGGYESDSSDNSYGGGYESESYDNSYDDYGSDDGFGGSDSQDSYDGYGGSDSQDSDDGF